MSNDCLVVKGLKRWFGSGNERVEVLCGIDVKFERGKTYAITGVSGTGKSTFLHLLAGIDTPSEGAVFFNGKSLMDLHPKEKEAFLSNFIGLVFQSPYLISELSVLENVMVPALISGKKSSVAEQKARDLLTAVGVADKLHANPSSLSGGQQQRVAVARAVINEPAFLLADEPTGNLDIQNGKQIVDLFLDCNKKWGMGVIVASHDEYVAHNMDVVFKLAGGILSN